MAMFGVYIAGQSDDEDHQYGHEKYEPVIGKLMAIFLFATGLLIAFNAVKNIQSGMVSIPTREAIYAAAISVLAKEGMYHYTMRGALKIESSVLKADAWHHRIDAISSIGSFVGIWGAMNGWPIMEPIAAIAIGVLIIKVAVDIYMQSIKELIDTAADPETLSDIRDTIMETEGVVDIDLLKTRIHVNRLYVDVEIAVNPDLTLRDAHQISEDVHDRIEDIIPKVKHCMVHVNPYGES
tara:strand:- start:157 stop:870 length:714 start_codon:yes stop_codon:yes gene_type:complete